MESEIIPQDLDSLLSTLKQTSNDYKTMVLILRYLRQTKLRRSELTVQTAHKLLQDKPSILSEIEEWDVREQLFLAAIDVNNMQMAGIALLKIKKQFGERSLRVRKLMGLHKEALGKYREAEHIYASVLEDDPTNTAAMKRQIAIRKCSGDSDQTIQLMNEYLKIFMADTEAWQELADLYLERQMYKNAAFCYEELMLAFPSNYHIHAKYAEILFTMGGYDNLRMARKYYAHSLEFNKTHNMRALYGLFVTTVAIASTKQGKQDLERDQDAENSLLYDWSFQHLQELYRSNRSLPLVQSLRGQ